MNQTTASLDTLQLKGSMFTLSVLKLLTDDLDAVDHKLQELVGQSPQFFQHIPIVIDLQQCVQNSIKISFDALGKLLRKHNLVPVAIQGGSTALNHAARAAGLAIMPTKKEPTPEVTQESVTPEPEIRAETLPEQPPASPVTGKAVVNKIVTKPVRSGQRVYAPGGDLIITAPVSNGAEVMADGNIHIYSTLRGRALAGANGNEKAHVFCHQLEAELIAIAGCYMMKDDIKRALNNTGYSFVDASLADGHLRLTTF